MLELTEFAAPGVCFFGVAVQFRHDPYHVVQVLDNVLAHHRAERIVRKRVREVVEIPDHVGVGARVDVEGDRAAELPVSGANVKDLRILDFGFWILDC